MWANALIKTLGDYCGPPQAPSPMTQADGIRMLHGVRGQRELEVEHAADRREPHI